MTEETRVRVFKRDQSVRAVLRRKMMEKYQRRCAACGISDDVIPLELAFVVGLSSGGDMSEDNLTVLCPNCHRAFYRGPRGIEFVTFLTELLTRHRHYSDVRQEALLGRETRYRADIIANRRSGDSAEPLLIECKVYPALTAAHTRSVIAQLEKYQAAYGDCRKILAIPATLRDGDLAALSAANIEAWDLPYIASNFSAQIRDAKPSYYQALLLKHLARSKRPSREEELIDSLRDCRPGRSDCYVYQTLVGEILECLFTPPLGKPIPELSDKSEANRRDFIMPNYTETGFWSFLRQRYAADYIVVDAKNYTETVGKAEVLQIANYLKPHGAGLFGLIFSRNGGDPLGCEHTLREQWMVHHKLILVLDDADIIAMLMAKSDGRLAEDVLGQKIEQFRLSM
ncbi:HNH endonuclease signature motif containing protein [Achromobacter denitrificans]